MKAMDFFGMFFSSLLFSERHDESKNRSREIWKSKMFLRLFGWWAPLKNTTVSRADRVRQTLAYAESECGKGEKRATKRRALLGNTQKLYVSNSQRTVSFSLIERNYVVRAERLCACGIFDDLLCYFSVRLRKNNIFIPFVAQCCLEQDQQPFAPSACAVQKGRKCFPLSHQHIFTHIFQGPSPSLQRRSR